MESLIVPDFNLQKTLDCGQFFRYEKVGDCFFISYRDRLFKTKQIRDKLLFKGVDKKFIINFFRLTDPYKMIVSSISKDAYMRKAIRANYGIRIIRQDPWECLISYLCSSNSNIPKIKKNLQLLSAKFGNKIVLDNYESYSFPKPGDLNNLKKILDCKVGFRAKFIYKANNTDILNSIRRLDYQKAKEELTKIHGVGEKIADCVCLFSLDKLEAFPVDVWIKRVMQEVYFDNQFVPNKRIPEFAKDYFGEYAGFANQFLFYYRRGGK